MPPYIRRDEALVNIIRTCLNHKKSLLFQILKEKMENKLKYRKPPWLTAENLIHENFCGRQAWNDEWTKALVTNKDLVTKPEQYMEGMLLPRKHWATINRIRTGQGRCGSLLNKL